MPPEKPLQILISAGEPSGDLHAARLAEALRARTCAKFFGMGGPRMRSAGVEIVVDCQEVAVFGLLEAWMRIPAVLRALRQLEEEARRRKPALAILTDSSGIHLRLAKRLKRQNIRLVYFISPQVWAWRRYRVRSIRKLFEKVLVIFPFEEGFYRNENIPAEFTGNPLVDEVHATQSRREFAAAHGLDASRPIITVLPGSRRSELKFHLPVLAETMRNLAGNAKLQFVVAAAPGFSRDAFAPLFSSGVPFTLVVDDTYNALAAADCAIVSSGTATVEAALLGAPMVVVYRLSSFTAALARWLVHTRTFAMVNLIAGRKIVPELIQSDFTSAKVAAEVRRLLENPEARRQMKSDLAEIRTKLGSGGAIERAADSIVRLLAENPRGNPAEVRAL
jgi:lipid-A-disaccharide synthase